MDNLTIWLIICCSGIIICAISIWIVLTEDKREPKYKIKRIIHGQETKFVVYRKKSIFYEAIEEFGKIEAAISYIERDKKAIKENIDRHKNDKEEWLSAEEIFKERL